MNQPPAVIFDVDGVLVDSYAAHLKSWQMLGDEVGGHRLTEAEFARTFGRTSREIIGELWPRHWHAPSRLRELDDRKEAIFRQLVAEAFPEMPGARRLIEDLHAEGVLLAAGSSGPPENVHLALDRLGLADRFAAVVTGRDVQRGKPDPEVFLVCAGRLGVSPRRCAVIEDSAPGIAAANAAGMLSIALVSAGHRPEEYPQPDRVVRRLDELSPAVLRRWLDEQAAG